MARTRGIVPYGDGELLDKEGKPIDPVAHHVTAPPVAPEPPVVERAPDFRIIYVLDKTTIRRDCEAWELAQMFDIYLGPWGKMLTDREFEALTPGEQRHGKISARLPEAEFAKLPADIRRHFFRVREDE